MKRALPGVAALAIAIGTFSLLGRAAVQSVPSNEWSSTADLSAARAVAASTLMYDSRVLVTGGLDGNGAATASAERYFPEGGAFLETPSMLQARAHHTSTLLPDGSVLVAGGVDGVGALESAEVYDPATNNWRPVTPMHVARSGHTATALYDGRVVIAGGDLHGTAISSIEIYDPWTESFERLTAPLTSARAGHAAALTHEGMVVIAGGYDGVNVLSSIDVIDPFFNTVASGQSLASARAGLTATTLLDGKILLLGGLGASGELASGEIYDSVNNVVTPTANNMAVGRQGQQAILLPHNAQVLIVGGTNGGSAVPSAEVYVAWQGDGGTFFPANAPATTARAWTTAAALSFTPSLTIRTGPSDGLMLLAGGSASSSAGSPTRSSELYGFATVKTDLADYAPGNTVTITGGGWVSGESVALTLVEKQTGDVHDLQPVTADASGQIVSSEFVPDEGDLGIRFYLTATGSQSQAQTSFTDSNSFNVAPLNQSVLAGSTNTFTWTFTAQNNGNQPTTTFTVPSGWTAPQTGAGAGQVTVTAGTCNASLASIAGMVITIDQGPGSATCGNNTTFTLGYANATAPLATALYTFSNQHGQSPTVGTLAVTPATGGAAISADTAGGAYTSLTGPVVTEGAAAQVGAGTIILNAPTGFIFDVGGTAPTVRVDGVGNANNNINNAANGTSLATTRTATTISFTVNAGQLSVVPNTLTWQNVRVRPTANTPLASGNITKSGTSGIPGVTGSTNFGTLTEVAGAAAKLAFTTQPGGGTGGIAWATQPVVTLQDAGGNTVTGVAQNVTLAIQNNAGPDGVLGGSNVVAVNTATGQATFSGLSINTAGTGYTLTATGSTVSTTPGVVISNAFNIAVGAASQLAFTTNPSASTVYGSAFAQQPSVTIRDAGGNTVTGSSAAIALSVTGGTGTPGASVVGCASNPLNAASGIANFASCQVDAAGTNYTLTATSPDLTPATSQTFTITQAPLTITANIDSKTYGDTRTYGAGSTAFAPGAGQLKFGDTISSVTITDTNNGGPSTAAAGGSYPLTPSAAIFGAGSASNYAITYVDGALTVLTRAITVTADAGQFKIYGDTDPTLAHTVSAGPLQGSDHFTGALSRVAGADVGLYAITLGSLAISDGNSGNNYQLTFVAADFEVKKRAITVTVDAGQFKIYGDTDPTLAYTVSAGPLQGTDSFTGALSRVAGEHVGLYAITLGSLAISDGNSGNNYQLTFVAADFEVKKRAITVTADAGQFKIYGDADPTFAYTVSGGPLQGSDGFTGALSRVAGANVGLYAITLGSLAISDGNSGNNYQLTFVAADFEVKKRAITVTADAVQFKIYGDADPVFAYTVSGGPLQGSDGFTGALSRVAGANVGLYAITLGSLAISDGNSGNNYQLTFVAADFEVKKRAITVTADAGQFKIYGDTDPVFAYTVSGGPLQGSDGFTGALSRVAGANVGLYAITLGSLAISDGNSGNNYQLTFVAADFEVKKRAITVTADAGQFKIYGDADPTFAYTVSGGPLQGTDSFTGALSRVAGADVGLYAITLGSLAISDGNSGNNYQLTFVAADFEIKKRAITVTAAAGQFKIYGDADPVFAYTVSGGPLQGSDGFTGALSRVAGADVGLYAITLGSLAISDGNSGNNYQLTFVAADFEVKKRAITVTAAAGQFKIYGDADPVFAYTVSGGPLQGSDGFTGALSRVAGADVGLYAITLGSLAISDGNSGNNYQLTFVAADFEVKKRAITVTADASQFKIYGDADPVFAYTVSGGPLQGSDGFTGALSRVAGADVGLYAITLGSLAISDGNSGNNYQLTFVAADFEVKKRAITVTADAGQFKIYGDADPTFAYTVSGGPLQGSDGFTGALSRVAGADVGLYAITLGSLAISDGNSGNNYQLTFVAADFEIKKRAITVTADPKTKVYGDPDPALTYQVTGGPLQGTDAFTGALARAAGQNVGVYPINLGTLAISDGNSGNNYALALVSANLQITARPISVAADPKSKVFGSPDPAFTHQTTAGSLAFSDAFTGALTRDPGELVGTYAIKIGTLAINDGNGGNNYVRTFAGSQLTILTACSAFDGFKSPIGGSVENGNGGSFSTPVRSFKLNSTVPVKFSATCFGSPLTTGIHTLQAIKYSNATTASDPVDATPTDAATTGNQFRLTGTEWHFNLNTKTLGNGAQGVWLFRATLFDGSTYSVWVEIKK